MRMTKQRFMILDILKSSKQPISAEMIFNEIKDKNLNLSTVYRSLDAFFIEGMISKSTMRNTAFYYVNEKKHHHFMICLGCQTMYELDCHLDQYVYKAASNHHFRITHHDMTVYGYCENCEKKV